MHGDKDLGMDLLNKILRSQARRLFKPGVHREEGNIDPLFFEFGDFFLEHFLCPQNICLGFSTPVPPVKVSGMEEMEPFLCAQFHKEGNTRIGGPIGSNGQVMLMNFFIRG